ncbi:MAG: hypothetical protein AMK73_08625 [Planctomycetes bacterium SM23_32]|nr:MAG: hypothetical protein AMK73_08625 [Planctomycetes bacterium SM23_32]
MYTSAAIDAGWTLLGLFTPVDLVIAAVLLASTALGFWSGFVWQLIRLASLVLCTWVTFLYAPTVALMIGPWLEEPVQVLASALAVFLSALLVCYLIAYLCRNLVNALKPQLSDRLLGAAFGLCKAVLLVGLLSFLVLEQGEEDSSLREQVAQSTAARAMSVCMEHSLPDSVKVRLKGVPRFTYVRAEPGQALRQISGGLI